MGGGSCEGEGVRGNVKVWWRESEEGRKMCI